GGIFTDYLYAASDRRFAQQQPNSLLVLDLRIKYSNRPFGGAQQLEHLLPAIVRADQQRQVFGLEGLARPVSIKQTAQLTCYLLIFYQQSEVARIVKVLLSWIEGQDQRCLVVDGHDLVVLLFDLFLAFPRDGDLDADVC